MIDPDGGCILWCLILAAAALGAAATSVLILMRL